MSPEFLATTDEMSATLLSTWQTSEGAQARAAARSRHPDRRMPSPNWRVVDIGPIKWVDRRNDRSRYNEREYAAPLGRTRLAHAARRGSAAQQLPARVVVPVAPRRVSGRDRRRLSPPRNLRPRAHLRLRVVLRDGGCRIERGAAPYAGLTRAQAARVAKRAVIRSDYGGDAPLFYRNLWDTQMRRTRDAAGRRSWLVKFYDAQALRSSCAYAWRGPELWAHVRLVPCVQTVLGAGKPR
jgi:hypothetical protein